MDFFETVKARASVRSFEPCEISDEELAQIVDAGRRAPSGYNRQPWEFVIVRDAALLDRLAHIQDCIAESSAAVAVVVDEESTNFWKEDAAAAIENMLLAVTALGYASLWIEGYVLRYEELGKDILGVPENRRLLAILPIGKPASAPQQAEKNALSDITYRDRYGQKWNRK